jgi:hypothetical protein
LFIEFKGNNRFNKTNKFTFYYYSVSNRIIHIVLLCFLALSSRAQNLSNYHVKMFSSRQDTILLDSLSVIKGSVIVSDLNNQEIPKENYLINDVEGLFMWKIKTDLDSFKVFFRSFPYKFTQRVFTNDYNQYKQYADSSGFLIDASRYSGAKRVNSLVDFGKLSYDGDFSRGVSFGNGQSLNLNSSFNLQLAGMLSKEIEITAAITDNNIPIQPEGNTAKIQDFDKIFIQLRYQKHFLKVGDFDIVSPSAYFMKFHKSLQGLSYWGEQNIGKDFKINAMASGAIAKGSFAVNTLVAEEGNQGPYKLIGNNGETFIIVISGSEQVFINGEKIKRGANNDYVIDYNLGEIRFTAKRIITKDLRIKVEFEYADRNYLRFLYHLNAGIQNKVWSFDANFYSEQDIKGQTINQDLSDDMKSLLSTVGDSIDQAFFTGANSTEFSNNRVLYEKMDTFLNGSFFNFYQYTIDSTVDLYSLSFSYVGEGNGNYVPLQSVANGRVFAWEAPDVFGSLQGSYEPVILLVTPKAKQLFTANFKVNATKNTLISTEFALSNVDVNSFSSVDDKDDLGIGLHFGIADKRVFKDSVKQFLIKANYEFKQDNFVPLERYRSVEFQRNWNTTNTNLAVNEHLGFFEAKFLNLKKGELSYRFSFLNQDSLYNGFENQLASILKGKSWMVSTDTKWLLSNALDQNTDFLRPKISVLKSFRTLKNWQVGVNGFNEINRIKDAKTDTLLNESFWWQDYTAFISSPDSVRNQLKFKYNLRFEHLPNQTDFDKYYLMANTFSLIGKVYAKKNQTIAWNLTYRNLQQDTLLKKTDDLQHFYLARVSYKFLFLKGAIKGNTLYEIGSGREQKIQYNYLQSPDGQGNYAWKDINDNGIQELNEFYVSSFANENQFLRVLSNSLEFQAVNATKFQQVLSINPKAIWHNKKGVRGFLARFSSVASVILNKKIFAGRNVQFQDIINPISINVNDTILVSNANTIRNTLFFNRNNTVYTIDYSFKLNEGTTLLTSGFEKRKLLTHALKVRWNINRSISATAVYTNGIKENDSDFYFDRKYAFIMNEMESKFKWLYKSAFRIGVRYKYSFRSNLLKTNGGQFAVINETGFEGKYTIAGKFNVLANFTYSSVAYGSGVNVNEQLEIDMLQGLQNGNNYLWSVSIDKTIAKNFQISVLYDGRKTGVSSIVHTGRAQVRAIF